MAGIIYRVCAYTLAALVAGFGAWLTLAFWPTSRLVGLGFGIIVLGLLTALGVAAHGDQRQEASASGKDMGQETDQGLDRGSATQAAGSILATDAVCVVAASLAGLFIIDGYADRMPGWPSYFREPLAADVVAFMFLPSATILAAFVAQYASQAVKLDAKGIAIARLGKTQTAEWAQVAQLRFEDSYVLVGRLGFLMPRKLRTNLVIDLDDGNSIYIIDPGYRTARTRLLERLYGVAPDRLCRAIKSQGRRWG